MPIPEFHALRTAQQTYVEYATGERELYDIGKDPYELNNLASKATQGTIQVLSNQLKQLMSCVAPTCREIEGR